MGHSCPAVFLGLTIDRGLLITALTVPELTTSLVKPDDDGLELCLTPAVNPYIPIMIPHYLAIEWVEMVPKTVVLCGTPVRDDRFLAQKEWRVSPGHEIFDT